ncbi:MAG: phosphotransferase [Caulobacteraceae bacterium]|nr:phosphotransferase [Caulobacteraceae bacterium]
MDGSLEAFVAALGLGRVRAWTRLSGGVSGHVWRVELERGAICVKRALAKLDVADDWRAPVGRCLYEYRWFETARGVVPGSAPRPLAVDADRGFLAMEFLPPEDFPLWKAKLLSGRVDIADARAVGARLGAIHAATAGRREIAERFASDDCFHALRLEPYLLATAARRPGVAAPLRALVEHTAKTRLALVHGDVSPKNILLGPGGPVFLDAETAWWGDPAFDLAFCLNHLLLKALVVPGAAEPLAASFAALARAHLARVNWEPAEALEARAAALLPGLMLARIDGKSPVEYLTAENQKDFVRAFAEPRLLHPPASLRAVADAWHAALRADKSRLEEAQP